MHARRRGDQCGRRAYPSRLVVASLGKRVTPRRAMGDDARSYWDALVAWLRALFFGREMEIVVIGASAATPATRRREATRETRARDADKSQTIVDEIHDGASRAGAFDLNRETKRIRSRARTARGRATRGLTKAVARTRARRAAERREDVVHRRAERRDV